MFTECSGACPLTTCPLSVFQAMRVSPRGSGWTELRVKVLKPTGPSATLCQGLHVLGDLTVPLHVIGKQSHGNITTRDFNYIHSVLHNKGTDLVCAVSVSAPDVPCLGLMIWAGGSVVSLQLRHPQRVLHIHRKRLPKSPPETRAARTVLALLMPLYPLSLSPTIHTYFSHFANPLGGR